MQISTVLFAERIKSQSPRLMFGEGAKYSFTGEDPGTSTTAVSSKREISSLVFAMIVFLAASSSVWIGSRASGTFSSGMKVKAVPPAISRTAIPVSHPFRLRPAVLRSGSSALLLVFCTVFFVFFLLFAIRIHPDKKVLNTRKEYNLKTGKYQKRKEKSFLKMEKK